MTSRYRASSPSTNAQANETRMGAVEHVPIASLIRNPRNARTHSKKQIREIGLSILKFGFNGAVLVDESSVILAGHGRVSGAEWAG